MANAPTPPVADSARIDAAVLAATEDINVAQRARPNEPPEHRFLVVSDHLAELLLDTARAHLVRAENNMKRVELEVAALKTRSKQMWDELEAYNKELDEYSHESIGTHERFLKRGNPK